MGFTRRMRLVLAASGGLLLAACQIEATTPMRTFDITNIAQTGVPVAVHAMLSATFASKSWCEDEGAMAIAALGSATAPIQIAMLQTQPSSIASSNGKWAAEGMVYELQTQPSGIPSSNSESMDQTFSSCTLQTQPSVIASSNSHQRDGPGRI